MIKKLSFIMALVLVFCLLSVPTAAAEAENELPDVDITSWEFLVANTYNSILEYAPPYAGFEGQGIDERIAEPLAAFLTAARNEGYQAYVAAAYRNWDFQLSHFRNFLATQENAAEAVKHFHAPGTCDHQTGLSVCITADASCSAAYYRYDNSAILDTELYQWALEHCHEYGFILRFPEGKEQYYGTPCEPGHFRYVGVEAATYIMENDLCLEEFILMYDEDAILVPGIN